MEYGTKVFNIHSKMHKGRGDKKAPIRLSIQSFFKFIDGLPNCDIITPWPGLQGLNCILIWFGWNGFDFDFVLGVSKNVR